MLRIISGRNRIMGRTRRTITLDEKIQSEEAALAALKSRYDAKAAEIEQLRKKKADADHKKLLDAFDKGDKTLEQVLTFIQS